MRSTGASGDRAIFTVRASRIGWRRPLGPRRPVGAGTEVPCGPRRSKWRARQVLDAR